MVAIAGGFQTPQSLQRERGNGGVISSSAKPAVQNDDFPRIPETIIPIASRNSDANRDRVDVVDRALVERRKKREHRGFIMPSPPFGSELCILRGRDVSRRRSRATIRDTRSLGQARRVHRTRAGRHQTGLWDA